MSQMSMTAGVGRTYRYYKNKPLFPFGFGLSYTNFTFSNVMISNSTASAVSAHLDAQNTGDFDGDEVVQMYTTPLLGFSNSKQSTISPNKKLVAYKRVHIPRASNVSMTIDASLEQFCLVSSNGKGSRSLMRGTYAVFLSTDGGISTLGDTFQFVVSEELSSKYRCEQI